MKIYELISGIKISLSEEENDLIHKINEHEGLNEREEQLAFLLSSRGILERSGDKYKVIKKPDVWRD